MVAASVTRPAAGARLLSLKHRQYLVAFLFVAPALINFAIFRYIPIFMAGEASLYDYSLLGGFGDFVGLKNYRRALEDDLFWSSMWVSFQYALMKVPLQVVLALLLAMFVSREVRGMSAIRTIIFFPVVTSLVVAAMLWSMMYNKDLGLFQSMMGAFGVRHNGFLSNPDLALPSIVLMMVWKEVGFSMIIFVAGLKGIPEMFYDAAAIDGASPFQRFLHITLPLLKPVTLFVVVTQTISAMQVFVPIFVMTQGGPFFATNAIVYYIYQNGFAYNDMGYASALSFFVLALLVAVSYIQFKALKGQAEY
ncbi:MAG: sugar ABC transporter permease [Chloroflexi bacterium]|nr:sugar ABC transporter permease [Chloroflexota bacterium]